MSNIFNYNNKFFSAFDKVINIFCLSLIWFMACIPVFTIGASCTALYWLIFLLIGLIMGADWFIMFQFMKAGAAWGKAFVIFVVMLVFEIAIWLYVYPNIARFENTNKAIVKNAALMSFAHLPKTILMLVILLIIAFLVYLIPFLLIFAPAAFIAIQNGIMEKIFLRYMSEEDIAKEEERNREYFN